MTSAPGSATTGAPQAIQGKDVGIEFLKLGEFLELFGHRISRILRIF
jgi:hypothetical protein